MKNDAVRALFSGNSSVGAHSVCKDKSQPGRSLIRPGAGCFPSEIHDTASDEAD